MFRQSTRVLLLAGLLGTLVAQQGEWYEDMQQVQPFLDRQDRLFEEYSVALGEAYYDYYSGVLGDASELDRLRGSHGTLERLFDEAYARRSR